MRSSVSAQRLLTILSTSSICGNSTVFSRILKLVLITFVVVTSRRCSDLSRPARWNARSCSPLSRHQTVDLDCGRRCSIGLFLSSAHRRADSDLSVGPLFSHLVWVRSFLFFFTLVLFKTAGTSRCSRLSVAPCTTFSLANYLLVCSMLTHVLRVVCRTDQPPRTSLSCSSPIWLRAWAWIRACFSCPASASGAPLAESEPPRLLSKAEIGTPALSAAAAALAVCLMVSGHISTQTCLY